MRKLREEAILSEEKIRQENALAENENAPSPIFYTKHDLWGKRKQPLAGHKHDMDL